MSKVTDILFLFGTATLVINQFRPAGLDLSLPNAFYILSGISLISEWPLRLKQPARDWIPSHPFWVPAILIFIGGVFSTVYAVNPGSSIMVTIKEFFVFSIWMSIGVRAVLKGYSRKLTDLMIAGSLLTSLVAIFDFSLGTNIGKYFVSRFSEVDFLEIYRYGGTNGHPNEQAMFLAVVYPLIVERVLEGHGNNRTRTLFKLISFIALPANLMGVLLTGSVTGYLGVLISTVLFFVVSGARYPRLLLSLPLLAVISVALFTAELPRRIAPDWIEMLSQRNTLYRVMEVTGPGRITLLHEGLEVIASSPWIGAGMDQSGTGGLVVSRLATSQHVHNTIIQVWLAGGILAFLGVVWIYWESVKLSVLTIFDYRKGFCSPYHLALAVSIISFFLMDMAQSNIYQRFKWLMVAILIGNRLIQSVEARKRIRNMERSIHRSDDQLSLTC